MWVRSEWPGLALTYDIDFFIGLNIVRTLSIIALLLVFASNIETLVHDIEAVNRWTAAGKAADDSDSSSMNSTMTDYLNGDYIECVGLCLSLGDRCS